MIKTHLIYKKDKWNMMTVEVQGARIILREISDQWGEESHEFLSRPALMHWVENRFSKQRFEGTEQEWEQLMETFKAICNQ
jgi:hypothetical protein